MTMLQLAGPPAETAFRLSRLRERLHATVPAVTGIAVDFLHFVHLESALDDRQASVLRALLEYGAARAPARRRDRELFVVPRLGTISPWASKATDIARNCALPVHRIERGRVYALELAGELGAADLTTLQTLLHDPMTETATSTPATSASPARRR